MSTFSTGFIPGNKNSGDSARVPPKRSGNDDILAPMFRAIRKAKIEAYRILRDKAIAVGDWKRAGLMHKRMVGHEVELWVRGQE